MKAVNACLRRCGIKNFQYKKIFCKPNKNIETCVKVLYTMSGGQMSTGNSRQKCPRNSDRGKYLKGSMNV